LVGLVLTQATLVVGLIVSVIGFLSMVGGVALIIRRLRTDDAHLKVPRPAY
jgi:hypothetical protein